MRQVSTGNAQVTFGILKLNRVHFVRHCGRAYLADFCLLSENTSADVKPNITAEIEQNGIHPNKIVIALSQRVIRLNLSGDEIGLQPQ